MSAERRLVLGSSPPDHPESPSTHRSLAGVETLGVVTYE